MPYELVTKRTPLSQLRALPARAVDQILEKINLLCDDPRPHEPVKKKSSKAIKTSTVCAQATTVFSTPMVMAWSLG